MKTNEQGLTKEEKIMFGILGIILIVAMGVLTVKVFSDNERVLLEETPIKENDVKEDNIENNEENTSKSESNLIEGTNENNVIKTSYKTSKNNSYIAAVPSDNITSSKPVLPEKGESANENPVIISWDFNSNLVKEAYSGDKIYIDRTVILENGEKRTAQVTVRKLIEDTYMIVDTSSDYIVVTPGTYRYSYTYADITKELTLTVYDYLEPTSISFLNTKDEIIDDSVTEEYLDSIKETIKNSTLTIEESNYKLTVNKNKNSSNVLPLVITSEKDINENSTIKSSTFGIKVEKENASWYEELNSNQILIFINIDMINDSNVIINIDGIEYIIKLDITIKNDNNATEDEEEKETIDESEKEEEKVPDEGPKPDEETETNENNIEENNEEIEFNIVASLITDNIAESTSQ